MSDVTRILSAIEQDDQKMAQGKSRPDAAGDRSRARGVSAAHFRTKATVGDTKEYEHDPPLLYNLEHDSSEKYDIAVKHPDVIAGIMKLRREHESKARIS